MHGWKKHGNFFQRKNNMLYWYTLKQCIILKVHSDWLLKL